MNLSTYTKLNLTTASDAEAVGQWIEVPAWAEVMNVYALARGGWGGTPAVVVVEHAGIHGENPLAFSSAISFSANGFNDNAPVKGKRRVRARVSSAGSTGEVDPAAVVEFVFWGQ